MGAGLKLGSGENKSDLDNVNKRINTQAVALTAFSGLTAFAGAGSVKIFNSSVNLFKRSGSKEHITSIKGAATEEYISNISKEAQNKIKNQIETSTEITELKNEYTVLVKPNVKDHAQMQEEMISNRTTEMDVFGGAGIALSVAFAAASVILTKNAVLPFAKELNKLFKEKKALRTKASPLSTPEI